MDYLFLSPIFDSISKRGYLSQFSFESLQNAAKEGLIDGKVFALGGVTQAKVCPSCMSWALVEPPCLEQRGRI